MIVAIAAPGSMGAGMAKLLRRRGAVVRTVLTGRSAASAARAREAGIEIVVSDDELVEGADFVLSIVPAAEAAPFAERLVGPLTRARRKPVYADCNAISPATANRIAQIVESASCSFVDAGIFGPPPPSGEGPCPKFFACGPGAVEFGRLVEYGLVLETLDGPAGSVSALKLLSSGILKGVRAMTAAVLIAAAEHGLADTLLRQLSAGHAPLVQWLEGHMPGLWSRAYRSIAEMEELEAFVEPDSPTSELYAVMARLYTQLEKELAEKSPAYQNLSKLF